LSDSQFANTAGSFAASLVTSNGPIRWRPSTLTPAPGGAPAIVSALPAVVSQSKLGHQ
jgi:hypothetical protein